MTNLKICTHNGLKAKRVLLRHHNEQGFGSRDINRLLLIPLLGVLLSACTSLPKPPNWSEIAGVTPLEDKQTVWREYGCDKLSLPFLTIERHELSSLELQAGQEFQHRFLYAICLPGSEKSITGSLHREIFFQGKRLIYADSRDIEFKPGKWADVATIKIPADAELGDYNLRLTFSIPNLQKRIGDLPFKVIKEP
jgi:hypothetical protein